MRMRWLPLIVLTMLAGLAHAEPQGRYSWVMPTAGWIQMPTHLFYPSDSLADAPAIGLRLGNQFARHWSLEGSAAYSSTHEAVRLKRWVAYSDFAGLLAWSPVAWRSGAPYIGAGWGWSFRSASGFERENFMTTSQEIGWNTWFNDNAGLRLEFRNVIDLPDKNLRGANKAEQQYWVGLSWAFGGKPRDTDGDGVPDRVDRCPATRSGAKVDARGCPIDSDGDGVPDGLDQCPGTPKGAISSATGCPTDSDGDGVYDGLDACPNTPNGAKVDARGCPIDTDGDGVYDGLDACPGTPAGAKVDATGCPTDADGDGVFDGLDLCPATPQGAKVDASGCPIEVTEKETELFDTGMIRLQGVNFEPGKSDLLPESLPILDQVGPILLKWPQLQIEVGGHTDSRGSTERNQVLSEARATAVREYLMLKFPGIAGDQLTAKGYGLSRPVAPNTNALNMAKNRRVEFVVLNTDVLKREVERRRLLQK